MICFATGVTVAIGFAIGVVIALAGAFSFGYLVRRTGVNWKIFEAFDD